MVKGSFHISRELENLIRNLHMNKTDWEEIKIYLMHPTNDAVYICFKSESPLNVPDVTICDFYIFTSPHKSCSIYLL